MASSMKAGAWAHIPGYQGGFAFTIADKPVQIVQSFRWEGVPWTASQILLRLAWCGVAIVLVLLAAAVFDRFDSARWFGRAQRKAALTATSGAFANGVATENGATATARCCGGAERLFRSACCGKNRASAIDRVGRRRSQQRICAFVCGRAETCDQRSALVVVRVAAGLLIAQATAPLASAGSNSRHFMVVARAGLVGDGRARNAIWNASIAVFVGADFAAPAFGVLACWIRTRCFVWLSGGITNSCDAGCLALLPWIAGAAFLPSIALALGVWSGTSKLFEGILTAMWYIGPINRVSGIDFTGSSNGPEAMHYVMVYLLTATALLVAAAALRSRQIRSN